LVAENPFIGVFGIDRIFSVQGSIQKRRIVSIREFQLLLDFATHCLKQSEKGKSIYNKLVVLSQVLKQNGRPKLLQASDWPVLLKPSGPFMRTTNSRDCAMRARRRNSRATSSTSCQFSGTPKEGSLLGGMPISATTVGSIQ